MPPLADGAPGRRPYGPAATAPRASVCVRPDDNRSDHGTTLPSLQPRSRAEHSGTPPRGHGLGSASATTASTTIAADLTRYDSRITLTSGQLHPRRPCAHGGGRDVHPEPLDRERAGPRAACTSPYQDDTLARIRQDMALERRATEPLLAEIHRRIRRLGGDGQRRGLRRGIRDGLDDRPRADDHCVGRGANLRTANRGGYRARIRLDGWRGRGRADARTDDRRGVTERITCSQLALAAALRPICTCVAVYTAPMPPLDRMSVMTQLPTVSPITSTRMNREHGRVDRIVLESDRPNEHASRPRSTPTDARAADNPAPPREPARSQGALMLQL
jgi:hypothetical protein